MATVGPSFDEKVYWTHRDFKTSSRLFMQHWMWQLQLGPNCFGAPSWLPKNLNLTGGFDALQPLRDDLKGQYDIVHVRAFASIIKGGNVAPFIQTLMGLVKLGGYIQWEESNPGKLAAKTNDPKINNPASQGLVQFMAMAGKGVGLSFDWITNIKSELMQEGLEVVSYSDVEWRPEFQRGWNDNLLTVYEELAANVPLAKDAPPSFPMTRERYTELFNGVIQECG